MNAPWKPGTPGNRDAFAAYLCDDAALDILRPVVIELGAGMAIPSVRMFSERQECPIIRLNPVECSVTPYEGVGLPVGALEGMRGITQALIDLGWTFSEGNE